MNERERERQRETERKRERERERERGERDRMMLKKEKYFFPGKNCDEGKTFGCGFQIEREKEAKR